MHGCFSEIFAGRSWRRDGKTVRTCKDAEHEAERILRRGKAVRVRILPVEIGADAVASFPAPVEGGASC